MQIKKELYEKLETDSCMARINTGANWVLSLCITPDEKHVLAGGHTDIIMIDLETRTVSHTFTKAHTSRINCMVSTKAGVLYTCSQDQTIKAWDLKDKKLQHDFGKTHNSILYGLFLTHDERYLVSASADRSIKIWDLHANFKCINTISNAHQGYVYSVAVTKDNKYLISGSQDRNISVWAFETGKLLHTFKDVCFGNVLTIKLTQDEKFVYATSTDGSLSVCDLEKKEKGKISTIGHSNGTWGLALTSDERYIFTFSSDQTIKVWDAQAKLNLHTFTGFDQDLFRGAITKDDRYAIFPGSKGTVFILDLGEKLEKPLLQNAHKLSIDAMVISSDDKYLITGGADGQVIVWNPQTKEQICAFATPGAGQVRSLAISPCNSKIAAGYTTGVVDLFSITSKSRLKNWTRPLSHVNFIPGIMFSMDGKKIVTCSYDSSIVIRNTESPYQVERINDAHRGWIMGLEITKDNKYIVTSSPDKSIVFWDLETRTKAFALNEAHEAAIWNLKITSDNKFLISCAIDTKINVWNIETRKKVHSFQTSHRIYSRDLSLSNDDTLLVSTDNDGVLEMHNLRTKQKIYIDPKAKKITTAISSDASKIFLSTSNSVNVIDNPFHKLTVQFSESCSPYSLIRFMPLTSYLFNQNLEHREKIVQSYPNLYVYPYTWNWYHIVAMYSPTKEAISICLQNKIPCVVDCFNKTPIHYLLENDHTEIAGLNLALSKFDHSLQVTQRPLELMSSLSDVFHKIVELGSTQAVNFLQNCCCKEPEPAFEESLDIFGDTVQDKERAFYLSSSLLYSQETRTSLLARKSSSTQKISIRVLPFYWDYSLDSQDMDTLVKTLQQVDNQNIFETKPISILIEYLWNSSKTYYYLLCLMFSIQAILISIYTGIGDDNLGLEITILILSIFFLIYELFEAFKAGLKAYITSAWNYLDIFGNLLVPAAIIAKWSGIEDEDKDWVFSFVLSFIYIRWISYFRMFQQTRKFIRMIIEIFKGATSFALVLIFIIFGLSLIFKQFDSETPYNIHLLNSYMLLFSNFDTEEISNGTMFYLLITIAVVCIVLLNMLIAIMGNTFGEVAERSTLIDSKEVLELISENIKMKKVVSLFRWGSSKIHIDEKEDSKKKYLFYVEKRLEEEDLDKAEIGDHFSNLKQQIDLMNGKIENLQEKLNHEQGVRGVQMQEIIRLLSQNQIKKDS